MKKLIDHKRYSELVKAQGMICAIERRLNPIEKARLEVMNEELASIDYPNIKLSHTQTITLSKTLQLMSHDPVDLEVLSHFIGAMRSVINPNNTTLDTELQLLSRCIANTLC